VRVFSEFEYRTQTSWEPRPSRDRQGGSDGGGRQSAFVVTNLPAAGFPGQEDPERFIPSDCMRSCIARGETWRTSSSSRCWICRRNRLSTHYLASNQLRLWLATFAYLLLERVRTLGWVGRTWRGPRWAVCV